MSEKELNIRNFSLLDAKACLGIRAEAFTDVFREELGDHAAEVGLHAYQPKDLVRISADGKSLIADHNGPIGFCTMPKNYTTTELLFVYVKLDRLKQGVGRALVDRAEGWLLSNWSEVISLDVEAVIPKFNRVFYERLGFSVLRDTRVRFFGRAVPALILRKQMTSC